MTPLFNTKQNKVYHKNSTIAKDLRPVFQFERILLKYLLNSDDYREIQWKSADRPCYFTNKGKILIRMSEIKKLLTDAIRLSDLRSEISEMPLVEDLSCFDEVVKLNSERLNNLYFEAEDIILNKVNEKYSDIDNEVVSFSGGKDSTVVSHLVRRIKGSNSILHIFGDTSLEDLNTYKYLERFKRDNPTIPVITTTTNKNFFDMCSQIGPPSRVMRWCCPIFKTGPIDEEFNMLTQAGFKKKFIAYIGIRKSESARRSKYNVIDESPKIIGEISVHPIFNWSDFDVFLYMLKHKVDFNDSYKLGFNRVGCWCCPMNSQWSDLLYRIYFPETAENWRNFLIDFAKKTGKTEIEDYVDNKMWARRQGGKGLETRYTGINFKMCGDLNNTFRYKASKRHIDNSLMEFLRPLGYFDSGTWLETKKLLINNNKGAVRFVVEFESDLNSFKVITTASSIIDIKNELSLFKSQLVKFENCIGCGACLQKCQFDAINCLNIDYVIDDVKCRRCGACIKAFDSGCLVAKVTRSGE